MAAEQGVALDRCYVLAVLALAFALNIADRYSVSTLIEPIKLELRLSDSAVGYLTGVSLEIFYVSCPPWRRPGR